MISKCFYFLVCCHFVHTIKGQNMCRCQSESGGKHISICVWEFMLVCETTPKPDLDTPWCVFTYLMTGVCLENRNKERVELGKCYDFLSISRVGINMIQSFMPSCSAGDILVKLCKDWMEQLKSLSAKTAPSGCLVCSLLIAAQSDHLCISIQWYRNCNSKDTCKSR